MQRLFTKMTAVTLAAGLLAASLPSRALAAGAFHSNGRIIKPATGPVTGARFQLIVSSQLSQFLRLPPVAGLDQLKTIAELPSAAGTELAADQAAARTLLALMTTPALAGLEQAPSIREQLVLKLGAENVATIVVEARRLRDAASTDQRLHQLIGRLQKRFAPPQAGLAEISLALNRLFDGSGRVASSGLVIASAESGREPPLGWRLAKHSGKLSESGEAQKEASLGASQKQKVALVVSLMGANLFQRKIVRPRLHGLFARHLPELAVRFVAAESKDELREKLRSVLDKGDEISHLFIDSHAGSKKWNGDSLFAFHLPDSRQITLTVPSGRRQEAPGLLWTSENAEALGIFEGIRGRFAKGAKIFLAGCNIMEGPEIVVSNKGMALVTLLKAEEASLYANSTAGMSWWEIPGLLTVLRSAMTLIMAPATIGYFAGLLLWLSGLAQGNGLDLWTVAVLFYLTGVIAAGLWAGWAIFRANRGYRFDWRDGTLKKTPAKAENFLKKTFLQYLPDSAAF